MEDDPLLKNGRQYQFNLKWKTTSIFFKQKTTSFFFENDRQPQKNNQKQPNNGCGTAPGNLVEIYLSCFFPVSH